MSKKISNSQSDYLFDFFFDILLKVKSRKPPSVSSVDWSYIISIYENTKIFIYKRLIERILLQSVLILKVIIIMWLCWLLHIFVLYQQDCILSLLDFLAILQLVLVMPLKLSWGFTISIVFTFLNLLVVVLPSFLQPTFILQSILSALKRLILLLMWPRPFSISPNQSFTAQTVYWSLIVTGLKDVIKEKTLSF